MALPFSLLLAAKPTLKAPLEDGVNFSDPFWWSGAIVAQAGWVGQRMTKILKEG